MKRIVLLCLICLVCTVSIAADEDTPYFEEYFSNTVYSEDFTPSPLLKYWLGWLAYDLELANMHRLPLYMHPGIVGEESFFPRFPELLEYNNPEIVEELFWTFAGIATEGVEEFRLFEIKSVAYKRITGNTIEADLVLYSGTQVTIIFGYQRSTLRLYAAIG
jgi:hypothetical protein